MQLTERLLPSASVRLTGPSAIQATVTAATALLLMGRITPPPVIRATATAAMAILLMAMGRITPPAIQVMAMGATTGRAIGSPAGWRSIVPAGTEARV